MEEIIEAFLEEAWNFRIRRDLKSCLNLHITDPGCSSISFDIQRVTMSCVGTSPTRQLMGMVRELLTRGQNRRSESKRAGVKWGQACAEVNFFGREVRVGRGRINAGLISSTYYICSKSTWGFHQCFSDYTANVSPLEGLLKHCS